MRGIKQYIAALGLLLCTEIKPVQGQILVPEELQATNNITLLQSAGARLWVVQLISENSGIFTYSLSAKQGSTWKRFPAFKLVAQSGTKIPEFTDIEVYGDRIYLAGSFVDPNTKNNCLIYFDLVSQSWKSDRSFLVSVGVPVINSLALANEQLFLAGNFLYTNTFPANHLAKFNKTDLVQVKTKAGVGASGPVLCMESDSIQKSIFVSGAFRTILGAKTSGFVQYRVADSTFLSTPVTWGTNVLRMRSIGSRLVMMTEDSAFKERKIFIWNNGANLVQAPGLDSVYNVNNFFSNKGQLYFIGDAQPELDLRSYGIFRISEVNKAERLYRHLNKILRAEGFEGNIYVYGNFVRVLSNAQLSDNFNLARIDDNFKRFYGRVFHDKNGSGKYEALTDILTGGHNVAIFANGVFQFMIPVEKTGYFNFIVPAKNTVTFKAIVEKTVELKTTASFVFRTDTFVEKLVDFPVQYLSNSYSNARIRVTAAAGWLCRKDTSELYIIKVVNTGLVAIQPDVILSLDSKIRGIQTDPAPFQIDPGAQTKLTWKLQQPIQPGSESTFSIKLTAPSTDFSDQEQIDFNASVANFTDNNPMDDMDTLEQTVTSSVDANAKFQYPEIPSGENFAWLDPDAGKIEYIIRFTNVTSDTVSTVVVRDTISTPDFVTYIQETGSSHPFTRLVYTTPYLPNKVIVAYTFSNLQLPPNPLGNSELVKSSGYIGFRLGLKPQLVSGTDLTNRASIYLDNEEPILTSTVIARVATSSVKHIPGHQTKLIYPNPFQEKLFFQSAEEGEEFSLYSLQGKLLLSTTIHGNSVDLSEQYLSSGAYVWTTVNRKGELFTGIISKK